ncbi:21 kDa protein-like [Corylus avellana]|uniref:21 kDa protein-like n=1 Tax=Corylus avellana TaxID=13451 RepID=UPI00286BA782|nr:21 kDa protein-like [Corylus avellana]
MLGNIETKRRKRIMRTQRPQLLLSLIGATLLFHLQPIPAVGDPDPTGSTNDIEFIRTSCGTTLYPDLCYTSLSRYANAIQQNPARLAKVAISVSLAKAQRMAAYVSNISSQADYGADPRAAGALHDCFTNFGDAVDEIRGSLKQMRQVGDTGAASFRFQMSNVQTWMSAALTDEDTCTDGFEDVSDGSVKTDVCDRVAKARKFTSNALALVNSYAAKGTP